jgi:hypothetical protein
MGVTIRIVGDQLKDHLRAPELDHYAAKNRHASASLSLPSRAY